MKFKKENGPHIKSSDTTSKIMTRLLIALMPIVCFAIFKNSILVYFYSNASVLEVLHPIFMILVAILTSFVSEFLYFKFVLKNDLNNSLFETSRSFSIIPGLFLALILPVNTPLYLVAFGSFMGNIVGKMLFGGFGENIFNPALIGYLFISASYSHLLGGVLNGYELDTLSGATPLANLAGINYYGTYESVVGSFGSLLNFFVGTIPGTLGETPKLLILFAFIYLTITKTIKWRIPTFYVSTVFVITFVVSKFLGLGIWYSLFHILSGGLLFGAVFMATDPVTSPITNIGQIMHGVLLGVLTVLLRFLTPYPEGVATSILFMNMLVPLCDKIGLKLKHNMKYIWILILVLLVIVYISIINIVIDVNKNKEGNNDVINSKVKIIDVKEKDSNKIYSVTSKGWGLIKADVEVEKGTIKSIIVTDNSGETQWNEIEKNNYIYKVINNQNNIDKLDAISGSTYTSDGLKNIVKKVRSEVNE